LKIYETLEPQSINSQKFANGIDFVRPCVPPKERRRFPNETLSRNAEFRDERGTVAYLDVDGSYGRVGKKGRFPSIATRVYEINERL